jgi:hypothetical protein
MSKRGSINIIIRNETDGDNLPVSTQDSPKGTRAAKAVSQEEAARKKEKGELAAGLVAVQQVKPYIDQAINFGVSQIQATTGSAEIQQRTQLVTGAASTGISITLGALVGRATGAAVTAAMSALQASISIVQNSIARENNRRIENENINLRKSRLGQSVNRSRTGGVS